MSFCVLLLFLVHFNANSFVRLFCISVIFSVDSCLTLFVYFCSSHPTSYHTCQICCHLTIINGCCLFVSVYTLSVCPPKRCHVVVGTCPTVATWLSGNVPVLPREIVWPYLTVATCGCLTIPHRCHVWLSFHASPWKMAVSIALLCVCLSVCVFSEREREREREKERENMCVYVCLRMCIVHLWLVSRK